MVHDVPCRMEEWNNEEVQHSWVRKLGPRQGNEGTRCSRIEEGDLHGSNTHKD